MYCTLSLLSWSTSSSSNDLPLTDKNSSPTSSCPTPVRAKRLDQSSGLKTQPLQLTLFSRGSLHATFLLSVISIQHHKKKTWAPVDYSQAGRSWTMIALQIAVFSMYLLNCHLRLPVTPWWMQELFSNKMQFVDSRETFDFVATNNFVNYPTLWTSQAAKYNKTPFMAGADSPLWLILLKIP